MRRRGIAAALAVGLVMSGGVLVADFAYAGPAGEADAGKRDRDAKEAILLPSERDAIEAAIRAKLRDPASVRFGEMATKRTDRGVLVCGVVNAKNSSGRYASRTPFIGSLSGKGFEVFEISSAEISEKQRIAGLCDALGVPIDP